MRRVSTRHTYRIQTNQQFVSCFDFSPPRNFFQLKKENEIKKNFLPASLFHSSIHTLTKRLNSIQRHFGSITSNSSNSISSYLGFCFSDTSLAM